jgi:hypothetical protein
MIRGGPRAIPILPRPFDIVLTDEKMILSLCIKIGGRELPS